MGIGQLSSHIMRHGWKARHILDTSGAEQTVHLHLTWAPPHRSYNCGVPVIPITTSITALQAMSLSAIRKGTAMSVFKDTTKHSAKQSTESTLRKKTKLLRDILLSLL